MFVQVGKLQGEDSGRAAHRTVTAYGRIITGGYGVKLTTTHTVNLQPPSSMVRYGVNTAVNGMVRP